MGAEFCTLCQLNIENINIQLPAGADLGIQLAQRTGSGISGIGEEGLSLLFLPGIELFEAYFGHIYLTANNQSRRRILDGHGDGVDGLQVSSYIFTNIAVAPGSTPDKLSVHIFKSHRKAIDFRLHGKSSFRFGSQGFLQKLIEFLQRKHILQAHQRHRMGVLFEAADSFTTHSLGGRIRCHQLRMGRFQLLQLPQKPVIFKVRHGGMIQHIVFIIGIIQDLCQFLNSLFGIHWEPPVCK